MVGRHDIGMDLLDHVGATLGQKAPEPLKFLTTTAVVSDRFMTRYPMATFDVRLKPQDL